MGVKKVQAGQSDQALLKHRERKGEGPLHITFHNPNTTEETARFLAKAISLAAFMNRRNTGKGDNSIL